MVARVKKMQPFDNYERVRATSRTIKSAILASADRSKNAEFIEEHNKVDGEEVGILLVRYYATTVIGIRLIMVMVWWFLEKQERQLIKGIGQWVINP